ncbi:hypothetical protein MJK70_19935 [Klebsiella pneumoniae]|nr:hypothetical protein MJK70_19935 [Klebsiella pneumoniae]
MDAHFPQCTGTVGVSRQPIGIARPDETYHTPHPALHQPLFFICDAPNFELFVSLNHDNCGIAVSLFW